MPEVRGYIEQLIAHGLLRQTERRVSGAGVDRRRGGAAEERRGRADLTLARQRRPVAGRAPKRARIETESWQDVDRDLFERLRALRLEIARTRGVPPYVIFHDTTLREMAQAQADVDPALLGVNGVGARKAEDLGEAFVALIASS